MLVYSPVYSALCSAMLGGVPDGRYTGEICQHPRYKMRFCHQGRPGNTWGTCAIHTAVDQQTWTHQVAASFLWGASVWVEIQHSDYCQVSWRDSAYHNTLPSRPSVNVLILSFHHHEQRWSERRDKRWWKCAHSLRITTQQQSLSKTTWQKDKLLHE